MCPDDSKTDVKIKKGERSSMETDQVVQLDVVLNQSAKVLSKYQEAEVTDALTTCKRGERSLSP